MIKFFLYPLCAVLLTVSLSLSAYAELGNLNNQHMKHLMDENVPIIDIRRSDEWQSTGVIKGSHQLTFFDARGNYDLEKWLSALDKIVGKNDRFILVCRSGNRTGTLGNFLDKKLGYKQVYHLQKGIKNWIKAGDKVVSSR